VARRTDQGAVNGDLRPAVTQYGWFAALRDSPDVAGTRMLVLLTVASYMSPDGTGARPSIATLSANTRLSDKTVRRHLEWAKTAGWLVVKRGGRRGNGRADSNEYTAALPVIWMTGAEAISTGHPDDRFSHSLPVISQDQEVISGYLNRSPR
jgi:hypothetical protein